MLSSCIFKKGIFIDCGAYIGDTAINFYKKFPNYTGMYYAMEASQETFKQLIDKVKWSKHINPMQIAIWDSKTTLHFDINNDTGNKAYSEGEKVTAN